MQCFIWQPALKWIPALWPLNEFIASNPMSDCTDLTFDEVLHTLETRLPDSDKYNVVIQNALEKYSKLMMRLINHHQNEEECLLKYRNQLKKQPWVYHKGMPPAKLDEFYDWVDKHLKLNQIDSWQVILTLLWPVRGWMGWFKWKNQHRKESISLDFIASLWLMMIAIEADHYQVILNSIPEPKSVTSAHEAENALVKNIVKSCNTASKKSKQSNTLWVLCIDSRSESFRLELEEQGFITAGFAGFFNIPLNMFNPGVGKISKQYPVLLESHKEIELKECSQTNLMHQLNQIIQKQRSNLKTLGGAFAWFETNALLNLVHLMARFSHLKQIPTHLHSISVINANDVFNVLSKQEAASLVEPLLSCIDIAHLTSKTVVLCGHESTSSNNPYQYALNCGACGGHSGAFNAKIAALILNDQEVRDILLQKGIHIHKKVRFISACHNTTEQKLYWLDDDIDKTLEILSEDAVANNAKSIQSQLIKPSNPINRAHDWSEINPEWGLVNNKAMIIGPRRLTETLNLKSQFFLHSYEAQHDADGSLLASIFAGPVFVAHMINMQYYFSARFPEHLGAGDKTTLNIYDGQVAVQGNEVVPRYGLPIQSLHDGKDFRHEAQRLIVFVAAPKELVQKVLSNNQAFSSLVQNGWVRLELLDDCFDKTKACA